MWKLLLIALLLIGCGTDQAADPEPTDPTETQTTTAEAPAEVEVEPTPVATEPALPSQPCRDAMGRAAAVDEMQDSISDFFEAVEACTSAEDWSAAAAEFAGVIDVDPLVFLGNVCAFSPEVADAPLCAEVADGT